MKPSRKNLTKNVNRPFIAAHHEDHEATARTNLVLRVACVVSRARLDLVVLLALDLELAVAAVQLGVVGSVANVVLAAQFSGDLVESIPQLLEVVANIDQPAPGLLGKLFHFTFAAVTHAGRTVESAVGAEQHVDNGIRFLGGFNGPLDGELAALIFAIGEQDHRFAPSLFGQHVVPGKIDRIVEQRAARVAGRDGSASDPGRSKISSANVDFGFVQRRLQPVDVIGEILQQVYVAIEADDEGFVVVAQNLFQKCAADFFLHVEDALLAAAGINEDSERERQIRFRSEVLDGLRLAVFGDCEIVFGQVGNKHALLVFYVEEELHHINVDLQRLPGVLVITGLGLARLALGRLGRGRIVGLWRRRGLLGEARREHQAQAGQEGNCGPEAYCGNLEHSRFSLRYLYGMVKLDMVRWHATLAQIV